MTTRAKLLHEETTHAIIGALFDVHTELGAGFLEVVYANSVSVLLRERGLRVQREVPFEVVFHGVPVGVYRADIVVESKVIVAVKAARSIEPAHTAQLLNYLRVSKCEVGILLNFGASADFKRTILTSGQSQITS